jgi:myo-inositol-1-phosphate synthase
VREEIESVRPWPGIFSARHVGRIVADQALEAGSYRQQIAAVERQVVAFRDAHGIDDVVMINLASTEGHIDLCAVHQTLDAFEAGIDVNDPAISPSMLYLYAANTMRVPYCSFAPSASVPALAEHAVAAGNPIAGADGKTGQTLVKTALASMFRLRRLIVDGWYSINFLGNQDGLILDEVSSNKAKVLSKASVLDSIVGYHVENHQVHIHYYKPRGDAKEAWDNVDIIGFAGIPMQMKINFLCKDSVLAAPLVIDLVRLLDLARRRGACGVQSQLSLFFKSPFTNGSPQVHDLFRQEALLLEWIEAHGRAPVTAGEPVTD